jgi:hypothetical protein
MTVATASVSYPYLSDAVRIIGQLSDMMGAYGGVGRSAGRACPPASTAARTRRDL